MKNRIAACALTCVLALQISAFAENNAYYNGSTIAISGHVNYFTLNKTSRITYTVKENETVINMGEFPVEKEDYYCKFEVDDEIDPSALTVNLRLDNNDISDSVEKISIQKSDKTTVDMNIVNSEKGRFIADGKNLSLQIKATTMADFDDIFDLLIAEYNSSGSLVGIQRKDNINVTTDTNTYEYSQEIDCTPVNTNTNTVRVFAWDSTNSMVPLGEAKNISKKIYSGDFFVNDDGTINSDLTGEYTVAYIGGSLTAGDSDYEGNKEIEQSAGWAAKTTGFIRTQFPNATFKHINAGIGGTGSEYGATRFYQHVASKNPDIVFIEFAVNDKQAESTEWPEWQSKKYMEKMVRICKLLPKEPVIYFVYAPFPNRDEAMADQYKWKQEIADYYGIKSINIDNYFRKLYEPYKNDKTYMEFLADEGYYGWNSAHTEVDVHPHAKGYMAYADAIKEVLEEPGAFEKMKNDPDEAYCTVQKSEYNKNVMESEYNYIHYDNQRISYKGNWQITDASNFGIDSVNKVVGADCNGAELSFLTKANEIILNFVTSKNGQKIDVYLDGEYQKTDYGANSVYEGMNNGTHKILDIPAEVLADGKEHRVTLKVQTAENENSTFNVADIIEKTY